MKYVFAISGGMDSMCMLLLAAHDIRTKDNMVIAHYNHKTRPSADDDAEFVRHWAEDIYHIPFYYEEAKPGEIKSEDQARGKRYAFLRRVAREVGGARIVTAHHVNDLVETVAINVLRGTGWRGLAPFSDTRTYQYFFTITYSKRELYYLAADNSVTWRQDPTNNEDAFLRNRIRQKLSLMSEEFFHIMWNGYAEQLELRYEIEKIVKKLLPKDGRYQRSWFKKLDYKSALEILRAGLMKVGITATQPQLMDFLHAIKTYAPEKQYNLPGGKMVTLHKTYFDLTHSALAKPA